MTALLFSMCVDMLQLTGTIPRGFSNLTGLGLLDLQGRSEQSYGPLACLPMYHVVACRVHRDVTVTLAAVVIGRSSMFAVRLSRKRLHRVNPGNPVAAHITVVRVPLFTHRPLPSATARVAPLTRVFSRCVAL